MGRTGTEEQNGLSCPRDSPRHQYIASTKTYKTYKTAQTAYPAFWTGLCMGTRQLIRLIDMNKVHWVMGSGLSKVIARSSVQINCRGETVCIASSSPLL